MTTLVGIPVIKDARRFHIQKGRRWSVFEHGVLEAIAKRDLSIDDLVSMTLLPRRVVIEIAIRLMRIGWVELRLTEASTKFRATPLGSVNATLPELPPVTKPIAKYVGFAIELVTGAVLPSRDLTIVSLDQWNKRVTSGTAVEIKAPPHDRYNALPAAQIAEELLDDDEELIRVDANDWKPRKLIAIAAVNAGQIEGLGKSVPPALAKEIRAAAARAPSSAKGATRYIEHIVEQPLAYRNSLTRKVAFRRDDLIVGGDAHKPLLSQILRAATSRVVVHSTFLNQSVADDFLVDARVAVQHGASIDVMWGQSSSKEGSNKSRVAADYLRTKVGELGLNEMIRVHGGSTRSHAKLILFDRGSAGGYSVLVGSCNWLASKYDKLEVSLRFRDPLIVSDFASEIAELARPPDEQIPPLSVEMIRLAKQLRSSSEATGGNFLATIVLGPEHADYVLRARDEAEQRILLISHKIGIAAKPMLAPIASAVKEKSVTTRIYYGVFDDKLDKKLANEQLFEYRDAGVSITPTERPKFHAKVLAWDRDDIVVSSQNWLSSDPGELLFRSEIGVHLKGPNVAEWLSEKIGAAREYY